MPLPSAGDLPNSVIEPESPALQVDSLPSEPPGKLHENYERAPRVAQAVKNLPAMQETQVQSLGWDDSLEKGMVTHSSIPGAFLLTQKVKKLPAIQET